MTSTYFQTCFRILSDFYANFFKVNRLWQQKYSRSPHGKEVRAALAKLRRLRQKHSCSESPNNIAHSQKDDSLIESCHLHSDHGASRHKSSDIAHSHEGDSSKEISHFHADHDANGHKSPDITIFPEGDLSSEIDHLHSNHDTNVDPNSEHSNRTR